MTRQPAGRLGVCPGSLADHDVYQAPHLKYDLQFKVVFDAIRGLMEEPEPKRRGIGFTAKIDV
jgi:hypothetical protein